MSTEPKKFVIFARRATHELKSPISLFFKVGGGLTGDIRGAELYSCDTALETTQWENGEIVPVAQDEITARLTSIVTDNFSVDYLKSIELQRILGLRT